MTSSSRRQAWDGEIDDLPAEILGFNIKEIPRSTLKDIANRLNADTVSAGNWESLAEKLGFTQNSVLENLAQQAKVLNTYPGLLLLQEWAQRSGSTAHVLLHALREILREDAVVVLVDKLRELHTMQLLVSVQDGEGRPKFFRVSTQKSAPLHASLDNTLQKPPYWYDIVGPSYDINWKTPSGVLQGTQLSLRQRVEPNEHSMSEIYGTSARLCRPPPSNLLEMNIPPEHLLFQEKKDPCLLNNLSNSPLSGVQRNQKSHPPVCFPQSTTNVSRSGTQPSTNIIQSGAQHNINISRPGTQPSMNIIQVGAQSNINISRAGAQPSTTNISPAGAPATTSIGQPLIFHQQSEDEGVSFEPMTSIGPPRAECPQQLFPNFDTLMSSAGDFLFSAPPVSVSSLQDPDDNMEYYPSSDTGLKTPLAPHSVREHEETVLKEREGHLSEKVNLVVADKGGTSREDLSAGGGVHEETAFAEGMQFTETNAWPVTASSFMHSVYVAHDKVIHFCNNPSSPQGLHNNSYGVCSASDSVLQPTDPTFTAGQQQRVSQDELRGVGNIDDYIPVTQQSLEKTSQASVLCEEESMQTECSDPDCLPAKECDGSARKSFQHKSESCPQLAAAAGSPVYRNIDSSKPKPCTYTNQQPATFSSQQQYADFQPHPLPHSLSLDSDNGYLDMKGSQSNAHHQQHPTTSSSSAAMLAGMHACLSVDSYMNTCTSDQQPPDTNTGRLSDSEARNVSSPNLDHLLFSRRRNPFPGGSDVFRPRDRRPLTHDQELLFDDPESDYTYIEAASVLPPAELPRRLSEGARPVIGFSGADRSGVFRDGDADRRPSREQQLEHTGSVSLAELEQVPGWNANITERTVEHEMSRYINDDGNFVVWRYAVGGKYVISVSHLRSIRHYAVYESEREGSLYFYIFPKGARFNSLLGLIQHCQRHGVAEPTKTFRTPDGRQAHRSSGRFSHVRLKFPIPAQGN